MSISQNFPDEGPSLNLNFASSRILDPRITFTRTSTGTYLSNNGLVTIASANTPRFDHSYNGSNVQSLGLLIEESRTNLVTYSEQFDNAVYSNPASGNTITANTITAPDGTTSADLVSNVGQGVSLVEYVATVSASSTTDYYATIYAKKGTASYFTFNCYYNGNTEDNVSFNFDTGVVSNVPYTGEYIFQNVGNGWYRCGFRMTRDSTGIRTQLRFRFWESGRGLTSGNTYFWGAQLEAGAFPTSYIPTVASTVTRSADNASMTGTNFSSWYNSTEGSVITNIKYDGAPVSGVTNRTGYVLYNVTNGQMRQIWWETSNTGAIIGENPPGSYVIVTNVAQTITQGSTNKIATAYKLNDFAITQNGGTIATDTSGTPPVTTSLFIGSYIGVTDYLNGRVAQLLYYPKRLTNSQLQNLTK